MKSQSTTSQGFLGLRWIPFSQVAGASFAPVAASFTPNTVQVYNEIGVASSYQPQYGVWCYRFAVTSGVLPAWIKPGVAISIQASVTLAGVSENLSECYQIRAIDTAAGQWFDVNAPRGQDATSITKIVAATAVDSGSGIVTTPTVSLMMQTQSVMVSSTSGTVILAPAVDQNLNAPYSITLAVTNPVTEYQITSPYGAKFDFADWSVKGGGTLSARFL